MALKTLKPRLKPMGQRLQTARAVRDTRYSQDAELRSKYKVKRWADLRSMVLVRDLYSCQMCGVILTDGRTDDRSALVDHIIPAKLCPDLFYEQSNLQACCRKCHVTTCADIEARHMGDPEGIAIAKRAIRPAA